MEPIAGTQFRGLSHAFCRPVFAIFPDKVPHFALFQVGPKTAECVDALLIIVLGRGLDLGVARQSLAKNCQRFTERPLAAPRLLGHLTVSGVAMVLLFVGQTELGDGQPIGLETSADANTPDPNPAKINAAREVGGSGLRTGSSARAWVSALRSWGWLAACPADQYPKAGSDWHEPGPVGVEALGFVGALGRTRTCNLLIRSQKLYPIELRTHPNVGAPAGRPGRITGRRVGSFPCFDKPRDVLVLRSRR